MWQCSCGLGIPSRRKVTIHFVNGAKPEENLQLAFAAIVQNLHLHFKFILVYSFSAFLLAFKAGTETPDRKHCVRLAFIKREETHPHDFFF